VITRDSAEPPYVQVAALLRDRVQQMKSGERLPSVRAMSKEYGVSTNTVLKAVSVLVDEGLVTTTPGWGSFRK
jgi:DNA-binding GntR family transcriptional regulator